MKHLKKFNESISSLEEHRLKHKFNIKVENVDIKLILYIKYKYNNSYNNRIGVGYIIHEVIDRLYLPKSEFKKLKKIGILIKEEDDILLDDKIVSVTREMLSKFRDDTSFSTESIYDTIDKIKISEFYDIFKNRFLNNFKKEYTAEKFYKLVQKNCGDFVLLNLNKPNKSVIEKEKRTQLNIILEKIIKENNLDTDMLYKKYDIKYKNLLTKLSKINEEKLMLNCLAELWLEKNKINTEQYHVKCINKFVSNIYNDESNWITVGFKFEFEHNKNKPTTKKPILLVTYVDNGTLKIEGNISVDNYNKHAMFSRLNDKVIIPKDYLTVVKSL